MTLRVAAVLLAVTALTPACRPTTAAVTPVADARPSPLSAFDTPIYCLGER